MTALESLIDPAAPLIGIGSGYQFAEGPVWDPAQGALLFSDIPGDARWRWTRATGVELDLAPTFKGNGMALDNDGTCSSASRCRAASCVFGTASASSLPTTTAAST